MNVSECLACRVIGQMRTTQRYEKIIDPNREKLRSRIIALASEYGRYGYKTITSMLQMEGFIVGRDRVHN